MCLVGVACELFATALADDRTTQLDATTGLAKRQAYGRPIWRTRTGHVACSAQLSRSCSGAQALTGNSLGSTGHPQAFGFYELGFRNCDYANVDALAGLDSPQIHHAKAVLLLVN